ncbi:MAG: DUF1818 family protein [Cyanobacteria bacterium M_surface_10_m2_179]|nr:DUF1818 family protein [Cyanobacteria bacterium M_surface_10_m2_179]
MIQQEGVGWRLAWDGDRQPFSVLVGGDGWATELTTGEAEALRDAVADLMAQHAAVADQLMAEEAIELELERQPWWLAIEGDRHRWSLRVMLSPSPGQRAVEGCWAPDSALGFTQALQQLFGQP